MKPRTEQYESYWDEGGNKYKFFKKGNLKRIYRKKFYRRLFKIDDKNYENIQTSKMQ